MSKAAPTDRHSTRTAKIAALLVSASFVNIPNIPSLAEVLARRSYLERQVVGGVATPDLEGGQVAVLRLPAASAGHATKVAYSCLRGMYVRYSTKHVRAPKKRRTSQNYPSRNCLIIAIDPIMDSRKWPQRDQKRRLAAFRAAERGRSWVL